MSIKWFKTLIKIKLLTTYCTTLPSPLIKEYETYKTSNLNTKKNYFMRFLIRIFRFLKPLTIIKGTTTYINKIDTSCNITNNLKY